MNLTGIQLLTTISILPPNLMTLFFE